MAIQSTEAARRATPSVGARALGTIRRHLSAPGVAFTLDQVVVSGANFFTVLWMARRLPASEFGVFSLAMIAVLFLANIHRALFTQPLNVRGASEKPEDIGERLLALLRAHFVAIPVAVGLLFAASVAFFPEQRMFVACAAYVACFSLQEMLRRFWHTTGRMGRALSNDLLSYGGQLVVLIGASGLFAINGPDAFLIMAATSLAAFLLGMRNLDMPPHRTARAAPAVMVDQWELARWLLLTVFAVWGASQVYTFLVSPLGAVAVASFAACRNLIGGFGVVLQSVANVLPTRAALLLRQQGKAMFRRHLLRTLTRAGIGGVVVLFLALASAPVLMNVLYDGMYDEAVPLFRMMAVGAFFWLTGVVLGSYALAMGDSRSPLIANLGATAFTLTGGVWLIGAHGIAGAAVATSVSIAVAALLQGWLVFLRLRSLHDPLLVRNG